MRENFRETVEIATPEAMHDFGVRLGGLLKAGDVVLLTGELGAGKTTLARGIGEGLGVRGPVSSPTFVLARTHPSLTGGPQLVHVDAYRLTDSAELEDLDIDFAASVVVAEWGAGLIDPDDITLEIVIARPIGGEAAASAAENSAEDAAEWDPADAPIATRVLTLTGSATRWRGVSFAS